MIITAERAETIERILKHHAGTIQPVQMWSLQGYTTLRRVSGDVQYAKVLPDGTVTAVAIWNGCHRGRDGYNGKTASEFKIVKFPNAKASHRNGLIVWGCIPYENETNPA